MGKEKMTFKMHMYMYVHLCTCTYIYIIPHVNHTHTNTHTHTHTRRKDTCTHCTAKQCPCRQVSKNDHMNIGVVKVLHIYMYVIHVQVTGMNILDYL